MQRALRSQQTQFEQIAAYAVRVMAYADGTVAERVQGRGVSWTYFSVLGVKPAIGRDFIEEDGKPGGPLAVILSQKFWQQHPDGRADRIGRPIQLDGGSYIVVGVLPEAVGPLERGQDVFVPIRFVAPPRKGPFFLTVVARLKRDGRRPTAVEELHAINRRIFPVWRASY
jgi:putative ABC transport system permease protein